MQENNNQSSNDPSALFPDETQKKSLSVYDDSKSGVNPVNNIKGTINSISTIKKSAQSSDFTVFTEELAIINKFIGENDYPYPNINIGEEKDIKNDIKNDIPNDIQNDIPKEIQKDIPLLEIID